jgi:2'-hydroxyisoflavone reductase
VGTRREFLKRSAILGGGLAAGLVPGGAEGIERAASSILPRGGERPARSLRVLILGGTGFIGPHLVHRTLAGGHELTIFTRGRSEPRLHAELFEDVENLVGDRDGDLSALEGRQWDVVIDNSGYTPQQVRATARLLADSVDQYIFTSTRGVYAGFTHSPMDEDAPVGIAGVPPSEWDGYGPLKALAEWEVEEAFPDGTAIVRPPIITGPGDRTDRFTFWYHRVDRGGEVLAPGDPDDPIQYVDVRDLVEFVLHMAEQRITGVFNVEAPAAPLTSAEFLHGLRATTGNPVSFTWVDWDFLEEHGLRGGQEIAAWRPPRGEWLNYGRVDNSRAIAAGMTFRPLAVTAMDTLAWWEENVGAAGDELRSGYSREREAEVLAAWRRRTG